ncbi:MAG: 1,4-dihydroxy-6-naphthoate synthase [Bacteroidales bacterium]|jgi:1,4-dihydroxy-6-naphthoate synthase|nr:1,4-dihydroxy-6-naphthoate synthase [Bacteroidales bacterium]
MSSKIKIAISPCPNDTFIVYAMLHSKIDTLGYKFEVDFKDIQDLNKASERKEYDLIKLSFAQVPNIIENYVISNSGSAIGYGCGPLLISLPKNKELNNKSKIALPGANTTASMLFKYFYGDVFEFKNMLFSDIEKAVLEGEVDAGVIIHENRFTYQDRGLHKIADLGNFWETKNNQPIPLGCFMLYRTFSLKERLEIQSIIKSSIEYAFENRDEVLQFSKRYAQEMEVDIMLQHIELYVTNDTISLSEKAKMSINNLILPNILEKIPNFEENNLYVD